jgi:hypothetical protein
MSQKHISEIDLQNKATTKTTSFPWTEIMMTKLVVQRHNGQHSITLYNPTNNAKTRYPIATNTQAKFQGAKASRLPISIITGVF